MPDRALRPCGHSGCKALSPSGRCDMHKVASFARSPGKQQSSSQRGYGAEWRRIRDRILKRDMLLCQPCVRQQRYTPATEVDHIVDKASGGTNADANLQSICSDCHKAKTARPWIVI